MGLNENVKKYRRKLEDSKRSSKATRMASLSSRVKSVESLQTSFHQ